MASLAMGTTGPRPALPMPLPSSNPHMVTTTSTATTLYRPPLPHCHRQRLCLRARQPRLRQPKQAQPPGLLLRPQGSLGDGRSRSISDRCEGTDSDAAALYHAEPHHGWHGRCLSSFDWRLWDSSSGDHTSSSAFCIRHLLAQNLCHSLLRTACCILA